MAVVSRPTTAVVICTHDVKRAALLEQAVASLQMQTSPPDEMVVVVDGDAELETATRTRLPGVRILGLGRNNGLTIARNAGICATSADLIFFLDDDARAEPTWMDILEHACRDPRVLAASGLSVARWETRHPAWLPPEFLWALGCRYAGLPTLVSQVRNVHGGCCVFKREVFANYGLFDARLGHRANSFGGGEEAELCLRASRAAPESIFLYVPTAKIEHFIPDERGRPPYLFRRCFDEGRMKAMVSMLITGAALSPELAFAKSLPRAVGGRLLQASHRRQTLGLFGLSAAVAAGFVWESCAALMRSATQASKKSEHKHNGGLPT